MEISESLALINRLEQDYPVDEWMINGIRIWPLIRIPLGMELQYFGEGVKLYKELEKQRTTAARFQSLFHRATQTMKAYCIDYRNNDTRRGNRFATFLSCSSHRYVKSEQGYYNIFCNPFIEYFSKRNLPSLQLERLNDKRYRLPRDGKSLFIQLSLDCQKVKALTAAKFGRFRSNLPYYDKFVATLQEIGFRHEFLSINNLIFHYALVRNTADYFKGILAESRPVLGFVVCYYNDVGSMAYMLACRELGITSVDIQHGLQGDNHVAYGRWGKLPKTGYELLPKVFWCWGNSEANAILKWAAAYKEYHRPVVGGNIWLNMWQRNSELASYYDNEVAKIINPATDLHILYTMQTGQPIPEMLLEAIKKSPRSWCWWIRLHPMMLAAREEVRAVVNSINTEAEIKFDEATDLPLLALLRRMDAHVTESSSTIIEAENFGVLSVTLHNFANDLFKDQIDSGNAIQAYNAEEIIASIYMQRKKGREVKAKQNKQWQLMTDEGEAFLSGYERKYLEH